MRPIFVDLFVLINDNTPVIIMDNHTKRVADYIIEYIYKHGTDTIFTVAGGGAMFLNDAVVLHKKIKCICNHHEQASAMAAEAYAKTKNQIGAVMVTSGPGSTNAITGIMEAYQNSIPLIVISTQTKKSQMVAYSGVPSLRQFGIQEVDIIPVIKPLTKYSAVVADPTTIKYHLDKAYHFALTGRPGPVWLDIPSDIASATLPDQHMSFIPSNRLTGKDVDKQIRQIAERIRLAAKPLIIAGGGIKGANARNIFRQFIDATHIPVVTTDMGIDILEYDHPYYVGHGGTKGDRAANIIIQNSDLIVTLGSRLAVPFIGHEYDTWALGAYKVVVDIDPEEHKKRTIHINLFVCSDVKSAIKKLSKQLKGLPTKNKWVKDCQYIKYNYALKLSTPSTRKGKQINMYDAVTEISRQSKPNDTFITDAGITAYVCTQSIKIKKNQRMIIPGATLTMGYNLPAIIGVWSANKTSRILCITGDGSFQMNIHELATIAHHKIPAKIFITNNQGYLAIRTTQKNFFDGRLIGEGEKSGVSFPNNNLIAKAYGIKYFSIENPKMLHRCVHDVLRCKGPVICDIHMPYWQDIITVSSKKLDSGKMVSMPVDDMYPFLSSKEMQAIQKRLE
jgi:acetolactate synthase I/II/III large subunit